MEQKRVEQGMKVKVGHFIPGWQTLRKAHLRGEARVMGPSGNHEGCWVLLYHTGAMLTYHHTEFEPVE